MQDAEREFRSLDEKRISSIVRDAMKHPHGIEAGIRWAMEVAVKSAPPFTCTLAYGCKDPKRCNPRGHCCAK